MKKQTQNNTGVQNANEIKLGKMIVATALKTIGLILFVLGFLIVGTSVVAPRFMLKSFDTVGFKKAGYLVQKRMYERDNNKQNLYNLIQRAIENEEYKDQAKYIQIMIKIDDYSEFCEEVDNATKQILGSKYSIYADSYDTYLRRHLVKALYNTDREMEAKMMAIDSVYGGLDELYMYVDLIVNDENLTEVQKTAELTTLYSRYSTLSAIETKLLELDEVLSLSETNYDRVIILEQKIKLAEIQYKLGEYAGNSALADSAKENIEGWSAEIVNLVNAL